METRTLAEVRAADADTLYSLYFPEGRVSAAAAVGCVCVDYLTCSECERILGQPFLAIELAARKKQCTDPPVPAARAEVEIRQELGMGPGPGAHGVEGSDAAVSGMADRHAPADGVGGSDAAAGMEDRLVPGSHPPADGVEGSNAAAEMVDRIGPGTHPPADGIEGSGAAAGMEDRLVPGSQPPADEVEGSGAEISSKGDRLGPGSPPPSHGVEESNAAAGMADRLVPGSHSPGDGVEGSDAAISSKADAVEGFEAAISSMAARLGLPAAVGERAKDVCRKMDEANAWPPGPGGGKDRSKGKRKGPLAYAACLSIACRTEGSARSLRELALAAACGGAAARKEIVRLVTHIKMRLGEEEVGQATGIGMVCPSSYVRRLGALARLGEAAEAAALVAARRLEEGALDVRHNPETVAAAVVCLALERAGAARKPVKDVATATGIHYDTINRVCTSLRPHAGLLFG